MKKRVRRYGRIVISLLLGVLLLWIITRGQDIEQIGRELRGANYSWIVLAMLCALLSHFTRALRWNMLIGTMGYRTRPLQTFYAVMTGYLSNLAIPRMGEVTRCVSLSKASGTPFNALAGTVLAERVFDLASMLFIVFITIVSQFDFLREFLGRVFLLPLIEKSHANWLPVIIAAAGFILLFALLILYFRKKLRNPQKEPHFSGLNDSSGVF